jgi:hypothetical protein
MQRKICRFMFFILCHSNFRLLLRRAMNSSAARRNAVNVDLFDDATGKECFQFRFCVRVGACVAEFRRDDCAIAHVKVDVTRREIFILFSDGFRR